MENDKRIKKVRLPKKLDNEIAELSGAIFGDGNLNNCNYSYKLNIAFNIKSDYLYSEYLTNIFINKFKVVPRKYQDHKKNCLILYIYSKIIYNFFHNKLGMCTGAKNLVEIPIHFKEDNNIIKFFIRGLFDTDGCVTFQRQWKYRYPLAKICTKHEKFAKDIVSVLLELGINSFICKKTDDKHNITYDVVMRNKNFFRFSDIIGSSNPRNIEKIEAEWGCWDLNI